MEVGTISQAFLLEVQTRSGNVAPHPQLWYTSLITEPKWGLRYVSYTITLSTTTK